MQHLQFQNRTQHKEGKAASQALPMSIASDSFNVPKFSIYQCLQAEVALGYIRKQRMPHNGLFSLEFSHRSWLIGSGRYSTIVFSFL